MPAFYFPVYVASKHAMIGYTTSCAQDPDMPAQGVRWCCLCPMAVNTGMLAMKGDEVKKPDEFLALCQSSMLQTEDVAKALLQLLQDVDNNGKLMVVSADQGAVYRRRVLVDDDGESSPMLVDKPLTSHPAQPGPSK